MINKILVILLLFSFTPKKETDLRKSFNISRELQDCEAIKPNQNYYWFYTDTPRYNNYTLHFKYLYCKYLSNTVTERELQDFNTFGMYKEVESISESKYNTNKSNSLATIKLEPNELQNEDSFIIKNAEHKIVIYNDDHTRMETRAFFLSKLALYKELGFTHLAMEAFGDIHETQPSFSLGYYFQEPVMAEIYREAIRLGYKLIQYESYEDDRMNEQAKNLYNQISLLKKDEKMLVFSGQTNMAEDIPEGVKLFGSVLKNEFNIDPLTIDLTRGIKFPQSIDVLFEKDNLFSKSGFISSQRIKEKIGFGYVDYFYIHPEYKYRYGRPDWLKCGNVREHFPYKSKNKNAVLIQVYYEKELTSDNSLNYITPADMIYELDKIGLAHFYLKPNNAYIVIYRDINNQITYKDKIHFFKH